MNVDLSYTAYTTVLLLASLSVVTTLIGVALALYIGRSERAIVIGIGFSAGIMLLISFFELVPQALGEAGAANTVGAFVLGMLIVAALHWIIPHTHLQMGEDGVPPDLLRSAYLVVFGLILHDVPEGVAMANAYMLSPSSGVIVALAIALHNIPEEFAIAAPIVMIKRKRFLYTAAFLSGLAEPLGAAIGLVAVHFHPHLNPLFMAFVAGVMVFISVQELLPMARRYHQTPLFLLGGAISALIYLLLAVLVPE